MGKRGLRRILGILYGLVGNHFHISVLGNLCCTDCGLCGRLYTGIKRSVYILYSQVWNNRFLCNNQSDGTQRSRYGKYNPFSTDINSFHGSNSGRLLQLGVQSDRAVYTGGTVDNRQPRRQHMPCYMDVLRI